MIIVSNWTCIFSIIRKRDITDLARFSMGETIKRTTKTNHFLSSLSLSRFSKTKMSKTVTFSAIFTLYYHENKILKQLLWLLYKLNSLSFFRGT